MGSKTQIDDARLGRATSGGTLDGTQPVERQAVVPIHGIGEQRPMATLRSFVSAFFDVGNYHSKPDTISNSYELRRIKIRRLDETEEPPKGLNADWPQTDFYEYYWAHQMYGTRFAHITSWLFWTMKSATRAAFQRTLKKPPYHPRLRVMLPLAWIGTGAVIAGFVWAAVHTPTTTATASGAVLIVVSIWRTFIAPLVGTTLTDVVGDAARYLDVSPQNVARRYDIIRGGIDTLRKLHEDHEESDVMIDAEKKIRYHYSRIVLVGHSLGSLIAYDLIRHYWMEVNGKLAVDPAEIDAVERFDGGECKDKQHGVATHTDRTLFRNEQQQCWRDVNEWWWREPYPLAAESQKPGRARWLISDLVTLGCPLTYAPVLMADDLNDFNLKIGLRELVVCPPNRSQHVNPGRFTVPLSEEAEVFKPFPILNHGAPFAVTRWTNFYYTNDLVGGPLQNVLQNGIQDVPLEPVHIWNPMEAHVNYWNCDRPAARPAIKALTAILTDHPWVCAGTKLGLEAPPVFEPEVEVLQIRSIALTCWLALLSGICQIVVYPPAGQR